jgi:hypothetical protein
MADLFDTALKLSQTEPMTQDIIDALQSMAELAEPDDALGMAMILEGALMEFNDSITIET